jgi:4-alpha-glucanotransferase
LKLERAGGILLHPTSFPGNYGIGDLGGEAYRFVEWLAASGTHLWQVLPLGPTGYGDSPYACFSAFAGNPLLISPEKLVADGLLDLAELQNVPNFPHDKVDFGPVIEWAQPNPNYIAGLQNFEAQNTLWLDEYALFMAAKAANGGAAWNTWEDTALRLRDPQALSEWRTKLAPEIGFQKYIQYLFFDQWFALKNYANSKGVKIIGDIPIFVAFDSADVWANPNLFLLDEEGQPTHVAGVPPDYFSAKGQYWGNPLYRWDIMGQTGYAWWLDRIRASLRLTDYLRIDHFRGFAAYWEVPVNDEETAVHGRWVKAPGEDFFTTVKSALGEVPIIAEDLGVITPDVVKLRHLADMPGMRVLQFAFGAFDTDATDPFLPHNYEEETVAYTGTHDNDTSAGWWATASENERRNLLAYLDVDPASHPDGGYVAWKMTRQIWGSVAKFAIVPLQDLFGLGAEARMNKPGVAAGNWGWRYHPSQLSDTLGGNLYHINVLYARHLPYRATPLKGQGNV